MIIAALCLDLAEAQRRPGSRRAGRGRPSRRGQAPRRGREEAAVGGYDAPPAVYGAGDGGLGEYGAAGDDALSALSSSIPGVPGEDYPIYAEVPETAFSCDGQVDGG